MVQRDAAGSLRVSLNSAVLFPIRLRRNGAQGIDKIASGNQPKDMIHGFQPV